MAKIIDDETIENVCILAKLSLSDEAKEKAKEDMQKMLDYVEKLDELDTDGVEPLSHIFGDQNVFREDVVTCLLYTSHAGCYNTCMNKGVLLEGNPPKVRPFFIYFSNIRREYYGELYQRGNIADG